MDINSLKEWLRPEHIVRVGGTALIMGVIFAETGLLIGFFFPGDSLLFTAGLLAAIPGPDGNPVLNVNIYLLLAGVFVAAVIGNTVGYFVGKTLGPRLFTKEDSLLFKKKYLDMIRSFYERYGRLAIIAGRFLPIIRTFVPVLAGAIKLDFVRFTMYNIIGGLAWTASFILLGYFLGASFPGPITKNLDYIVIFLIIITILPVIRTYRKERRRHLESQKATGDSQQ
jgi:membrane-associated protein